MPQKPPNQEFGKIFDSVASKYDQISNSYVVTHRIEWFKKYSKGKCLEVGSGSGKIAKALQDQHDVIVMDISNEMIKVVKRKLKIKAYVADAEKLPFKDKSFDTIVAAEMIYYLDRPEVFVAESRRVLKNKGRLLISSATKIAEIYDLLRRVLRKLGLSGMYFDDHNRQFMSAQQIKVLLYQNGFRIKRLERAIILPFKIFDPVNRFLEKTPLKYLGSFIYVYAEK